MPHVDLKLAGARSTLLTSELQAWMQVVCTELNTLRTVLELPLLEPQTLHAAVQAARSRPQSPEGG